MTVIIKQGHGDAVHDTRQELLDSKEGKGSTAVSIKVDLDDGIVYFFVVANFDDFWLKSPNFAIFLPLPP